MLVFKADALERVGRKVFCAAGASEAEAATVAAALVEANLVGHDSHGIIRIPQYVAAVEQGDIQPGATLEVERQTAVAATLNGNWGFGQVICQEAVNIAIEKAASCGVAALTVRQASHIGRLGSYVESVASHNMIGLMVANMHGQGASVVPWGGKEPRLGTNPLAAGVPTGEGQTVVLDMTTSVVAEGKVRLQRNRGEAVPPGWIVDAAGQPTNDPNAFYGPPRGGILPFGGEVGHKGYGLGVVVDLLAGALTGAGCTGNPQGHAGNGVFLLVINVGLFLPLEAFFKETSDFIAFVKSAALAPGYEAILMPGEVEAAHKRQRLEEGISVEEETWEQIVECGARLGCTIA